MMHQSHDVFLDDGDEFSVGGNGNPLVWVRIGLVENVTIFGRNADELERLGEAFFAAARDLRGAQQAAA